jgi:CHAT domain-containing protein/tetratricopeptide (TPR) repeat protein
MGEDGGTCVEVALIGDSLRHHTVRRDLSRLNEDTTPSVAGCAGSHLVPPPSAFLSARSRNGITILALIFALGLTPACQTATPTMSLDEARQVTATFSETFVPPPRTISDIKALLEPRTWIEPYLMFLRQSVESEDPPDPDPVDLSKSHSETMRQRETAAGRYWRRGMAARRLGRFGQAIEDFNRAAELVTPDMSLPQPGWDLWGTNFGMSILRELGETEAAAGNHGHAIKHLEAAAAISLRQFNGRRYHIFGLPLVEVHARTGNLQAAEGVVRTLTRLQREWHAALSRLPIAPHPWRRASYDSTVAAAQATLLELRGQFVEAERFWRASIAPLAGIVTRNDWLESRLDARTGGLALCLLKQGRLLEAEVEARKALRSAVNRPGKFGSETMTLLNTLVRVLREQGRYGEARVLAREAINLYERGGAPSRSSPPVVAPRIDVAATLAAEGRWQESLFEYETVRRLLEDEPLYQRLTQRDPTLAVVLLRTDRLGEVQTALSSGIEQSRRLRGDKHPSTAELRGLWAIALAARGDASAAREEFERAAEVLLTGSEHFDDELTGHGERKQRRNWILAEYIDLLSRARGAGVTSGDGIAEAFRIAEAARGGMVERALGAAIARSAATTPALADLARREQDAAKQIAALQSLLATTSTGPEADLRRRIEALQRARQTLVQGLTQKFPAYTELVNPRPATIEQARTALRPGESLLATYVGEERTYVWAVPKTGPVAFAVVPLGESAIAASVVTLRKAPDSGVRRLQDMPAFDVGAAHELYRHILEPVKAGWESASSLIVVAHGPLARIPWSLLPTRATSLGPERAPLFSNYRAIPWLVRTHAVTVVPSVATFAALRALPPGDPQRRPFVGFGDPYFSAAHVQEASAERVAALSGRGTLAVRDVVMSPGAEVQESRLAMLPRLPDTAEEIRAMAHTLGADEKRDVFLGVAANEQAVKTLDLSRYRVIAFATHGLVPGDIDGLTQPALALTAPQVANVGGDGLLTMEEILALRLNADWVVLSACNTANGAGAGAEAISGLGRAFFYAGARALLVTHWPVETTSAKAITTEIFLRQAADTTLTRATALQKTINTLIDEGGLIDPSTGQMLFSYAHPIFWAPFVLVGDGG